MNLDLTTAWRAVKAALPHLRAGGAIVDIAGQAGRDDGGPGSVAYATATGAVMTMTRGLAKELGPDIRVTTVDPGMIDTEVHSTFTEDAVRVAIAGATPLKREGRPHDVADLVTSLASDRASFVDGAGIDIDGGPVFSRLRSRKEQTGFGLAPITSPLFVAWARRRPRDAVFPGEMTGERAHGGGDGGSRP